MIPPYRNSLFIILLQRPRLKTSFQGLEIPLKDISFSNMLEMLSCILITLTTVDGVL